MRIKVILACTKCNQRNYKTTKNEALRNDRLEAKKFCKHCQEHTLHKETK